MFVQYFRPHPISKMLHLYVAIIVGLTSLVF